MRYKYRRHSDSRMDWCAVGVYMDDSFWKFAIKDFYESNVALHVQYLRKGFESMCKVELQGFSN